MGCKHTGAPEWPEQVKSHFILEFTEHGEPVCYSAEIISTDPYILGDALRLNDARACRGLSGYLPLEMRAVINYKDQSLDWIDQNCKRK